jgi:hypothetical protein
MMEEEPMKQILNNKTFEEVWIGLPRRLVRPSRKQKIPPRRCGKPSRK